MPKVLPQEPKLKKRILRAYREGKTVVLFVGAPAATHPGTGGVPGVSDTADLAKARLCDDISDELAKSWEHLAAGERYQRAFTELIDAAGADAADAVIREAVLSACEEELSVQRKRRLLAGDFSACRGLMRHSSWALPPAVSALGSIMAKRPDQTVVVTTNFDPLVEIAASRRGAEPTRVVLGHDSAPPGCPQGPAIVHVHGFWFGSHTLHDEKQLAAKAKKNVVTYLAATLQRASTVVLACGGWDDAFLDALRRTVGAPLAGGASPSVAWGFYEKEDPRVRGQLPDPSKVRSFEGVDVHRLLADVDSELTSPPEEAEQPKPSPRPKGDTKTVNTDGVHVRTPDPDEPPRSDVDELKRAVATRTCIWPLASSAELLRRNIDEHTRLRYSKIAASLVAYCRRVCTWHAALSVFQWLLCIPLATSVAVFLFQASQYTIDDIGLAIGVAIPAVLCTLIGATHLFCKHCVSRHTSIDSLANEMVSLGVQGPAFGLLDELRSKAAYLLPTSVVAHW